MANASTVKTDKPSERIDQLTNFNIQLKWLSGKKRFKIVLKATVRLLFT